MKRKPQAIHRWICLSCCLWFFFVCKKTNTNWLCIRMLRKFFTFHSFVDFVFSLSWSKLMCIILLFSIRSSKLRDFSIWNFGCALWIFAWHKLTFKNKKLMIHFTGNIIIIQTHCESRSNWNVKQITWKSWM